MCRIFFLALALVGVALPAFADPVVTTVEWVDDGGQKGTGQFEGLVDATSIVGRLRLGSEKLVLQGTVDGTALAGTIKTPGGADVATVTGTVGENWSLGDFTVTGLPGGVWQTLAAGN